MNYQLELEKIINNIALEPKPKRLLLHSCCAPCSSYVLEYLRAYFLITVLYYNPNISMREEYAKRAAEQKRFIEVLNRQQRYHPISYREGEYEPDCFYEIAKGRERQPEGGERCFLCYELRLRKAAEAAKAGGYDYFTTTLTISPLKDADKLNEIGNRMALEYQTGFLPSDFKKKNGYVRSVELSKEYDLYRQDYCGCIYSKENPSRNKE